MTRTFSWIFSAVAVGFFALLVGVFVVQSVPVWRHEGLGYLTGTQWHFRQHEFGALPMIYGSIVVTLIAVALAAPVGIGAAVFGAEYLPRQVRVGLKILIELLAGVPSVIYGLLGILLLRDWIYATLERFDPLSGDTLLTAGVLLAVMILPTVATLSDDALRSVAANQRQAARALGLTRAEVVWSVSIPQARRGLTSAVVLSIGRALGETIAVFLVVGRQDNHLADPWYSPSALIEAGQTLTSKIGGSETNIAYGDPVHWAAIIGLGLVLLIITGGLAIVGTSVFNRTPHEA